MIIHNFKILCIMAINYSLVKLASKFGDKAGVPLFYARAQMKDSISLKKFAKLISMQTTVSYADVTAVLVSMQENMIIELQRGPARRGAGRFRRVGQVPPPAYQ